MLIASLVELLLIQTTEHVLVVDLVQVTVDLGSFINQVLVYLLFSPINVGGPFECTDVAP